MNKLVALLDYGQSYWLDNLSRDKILSGELEKRVDEQGLRGITSNPSIFDKAFNQGNAYDDEIGSLAREGKTTQEIYEALTVQDVTDACDILRPVYETSGGTDGFVSLEVSPYLARDTEGTMAEARRLYRKVDRPNCFIKIPGTQEGLPAIEQMLYEGVNINITLLFALDRYEEVARTYIRAVERRIKESKPVDKTVSVASFFLSRIDTLVDELLQHHVKPSQNGHQKPDPATLLGKAGTASARMAYQRFKKIFSGDQWRSAQSSGAHVQRVLWASTSNKDPAFSDVRYVNALIGPETVNTLPDNTIEAFADHGVLRKNTIEEDLPEAMTLFESLQSFDIDIDFVTRVLEYEGIQKFIDSYSQLIKGLDEKRKKYQAEG